MVTLPTNSNALVNDTDYTTFIRDPEYFNLEVSQFETSLVINASKKGIDAFLRLYSALPLRSQTISFRDQQRVSRRRQSDLILENQQVLPTDPTLCILRKNTTENKDEINSVINELHILFLESSDKEVVLCVGLSAGIPVLTVNEMGWHKFLDILRYLRDHSYWFYVTIPNLPIWKHLPFQLTTPYRGDAQDRVCQALECIRLEPEDHIYMNIHADTDAAYITGNCAGILLFSQWFQRFASSQESSEDILNIWNNPRREGNNPDFPQEERSPGGVHLRKIQEESSYAIFAFAKKEGSDDVYIFGNSKGFQELSEVVEEWAFRSGGRKFSGRKNPEKRPRGHLTKSILMPKGFCSGFCWFVSGGEPCWLSHERSPSKFPCFYENFEEFAYKNYGNLVNKRTILPINSDELANDTGYTTFIRDPEYFNLEISKCKTSLVINASKKGIDAFLKLHGSLRSDSSVISFRDLQRIPRRSESYTILENAHVLPTDPTPYRAEWANGSINSVMNVLITQFLQDNNEEVVFCIGLSSGRMPVLTVNEKGWLKFLNILRCLRDHSYWFYVTAPNLPFWKELPFQLTTPYCGDAEHHVVKALACIRLEPEEDIYISTRKELISGNCAGVLFFAQWLHRFASSQERSKDILNTWNKPPKEGNSPGSPEQEYPPGWVRLRKIQEDSPYAVFTFAEKGGSDDVYIFGNSEGFQELSEVVERWTFKTDGGSYHERKNPKIYIKGDSTGGMLMPEGFRSIPGWNILGGAFNSLSYNPVKYEEEGPYPKNHNFVNKRIILPTNSNDLVDDTEYTTFIRDPEYFNLEVSECKTNLVINASKKGIDAFIQLYGSFPSHSKIISFKELQRAARRPIPYTILDNEHVLPADPTPYRAEWKAGGINSVINVLHIRFLGNSDEDVVFCIGLNDGIPVLTVNEKGWHKFLDILRCLHDRSYWFYVTIPNLPFWKPLPFQLTTPYRGDAEDHVFKALTCIRLEPEEHIYINTSLELISGNCAGLLFFAHWLHHFAFSQARSKDILNIWNKPPEKERLPSWVRLRKIPEESPDAVFTFAKKEGSDDVYIFGNSKGIQELSEVVERSAFETDRGSYHERTNPKIYTKGDSAGDILVPEGFRSIPGWNVLGGACNNASYNPVKYEEQGPYPANHDLVIKKIILPTNPNELVNDTNYATFIRDPEYFNLEVSACKTSLVINASKKGIDAFLRQYGSVPTHSKIISFKDLQRVSRRPVPYTILDNEQVLPTDPTPYIARSRCGSINSVINVLHIQFLESCDEDVVFCIGLSDGIPALTVNEKGWHKFLDILRCLRDHSYWFYVTIPNLPLWKHLPFQLTTPYRGDAQDHIFKALACIRLEPEENICIDPRPYRVRGNCAGLLFFAQWLHRFAFSQESSKDILNTWNKPPKKDNSPDFAAEESPPSWVYLRKIQGESPYAIFTFADKDDGDDVYIFGNPEGFQELSEVVEEWAFETDHDNYCERRHPKIYTKGDSAGGILMPEWFRPIPGWRVLGGAFNNPSYDIACEKGSIYEKLDSFVNKRSILNDPMP